MHLAKCIEITQDRARLSEGIARKRAPLSCSALHRTPRACQSSRLMLSPRFFFGAQLPRTIPHFRSFRPVSSPIKHARRTNIYPAAPAQSTWRASGRFVRVFEDICRDGERAGLSIQVAALPGNVSRIYATTNVDTQQPVKRVILYYARLYMLVYNTYVCTCVYARYMPAHKSPV